MKVLQIVGLLLILGLVPDLRAGESESAGDQKLLTVDEILQRDPADKDYVEAPRCLRTQLIRSSKVLDDRHVVFEMPRKKYFLVQFSHRCPELRRNQAIVIEPTANRLCQLDGIRPLLDRGFGELRPGMRCAIPAFLSITKEGVVQLKDALKAEKRKKRQERKNRKS